MESIVALLFALGLLLAIVTLVGHGIWVFLAWLIRSAFGLERRGGAAGSGGEICPRCRATTVPRGAHCPLCGWPRFSPPDHEEVPRYTALQVVHSLQEQVREQAELGVLDAGTAGRLQEVLRDRATALRTDERELVVEAVVVEDSPPWESPAIELGAEESGLVVPAPPTVTPAGETVPPVVTAGEEGAGTAGAEETMRRRAKTYAAHRRQAQATEPPEEEARPAAAHHRPAKETVPLSRLLAAFMEERNIQWGELIGGLLIVGCSIALVISFWSEIAERPWLKFVVFNGVTAALFGAGLYADRRLKLANTAQGLLVTSSILVPLNFLAIASFTGSGSLWLTIGGEILSAALFAALLWLSGQVIVGSLRPLLLAGVLIPSLMTLLTRRFVGEDPSTLTLWGFAAATIAPYVALSVAAIRSIEDRPSGPTESHAVHRYYKWLGIVSFACLLPLALLLVRSGDAWAAAHRLSPSIGLLGAPALLSGVFAWRRMLAPELSTIRTAGIAIGNVGAGVLLAALILAWPQPLALILAAVIDAAIFLTLGFALGIPLAQQVAVSSLGIAWIIAGHAALGRVSWWSEEGRVLRDQVLSAATGWILLPFALLVVAAAWGWQRSGRRELGAAYLPVAALAAALSLLAATVFGFARSGDPHGVTWLYLLYALGLAGATMASRHPLAAAGMSLVTWGAAVQGVVFAGEVLIGELAVTSLELRWLSALLLHASLVTAAGAVAARQVTARWSSREVLCGSAILSLIGAQLLLLYWLPILTPVAIAGCLAWFALVTLGLALVLREPICGCSFQVYTVAAFYFGVLASWSDSTLQQIPAGFWWQPPLLATQGLALSGWCLAWAACRLWFRLRFHPRPKRPERGFLLRTRAFLETRWSSVDHCVYAGLAVLLAGLAIYAALPGAFQELAPRPEGAVERTVLPIERFEVRADSFRIDHHAARAATTWWFLGVLLVAGCLGLSESGDRWRAALLAVTAWSAILLLAAFWESQVAVASALRWGLALGLLLGSSMVWLRGFVPWPRFLPFSSRSGTWEGHGRVWRTATLALTFIPLLGLGFYVLAAAVSRAQLDSRLLSLRIPFLLWTGLVLLVVAVSREAAWRLRGSPSPDRLFQIRVFSGLGLLVGLAPSLVWLLYVVAVSLRQHPLTGPDPESLFVRMGLAASYAIPLLIMTLALVGTAIRERSQGYAFAGASMLLLAVTAGFLLLLTRWGLTLDTVAWIRLAQLNALVAAVYLCAWQAGRKIAGRGTEQAPLLVALLGFAALLCLLHLSVPIGPLFWTPGQPRFAADCSHLAGWLSVAVTITAAGWYCSDLAGVRRVAASWLLQAAGLLSVALLVTQWLGRWDSGNWLAYHTLLVLWNAAVLFLLLRAVRTRRSEQNEAAWPGRLETTLAPLVVLAAATFAVRALVGDPQAPWWGVGALMVAATECVLLSWRSARRRATYAAGLLINLAATAAGLKIIGSALHWLDLISMNMLAATLPCGLWLLLERILFQPAEAGAGGRSSVGLHRVAAAFSLGAGLLLAGCGLTLDAFGSPASASLPLLWCAYFSVAQAVAVTLWDARSRLALFSLYLTGLLGLGLALDSFQLRGDMLRWTGTIFAAAYALATSFVANRRRTLAAMLRTWNSPITPRRCRRAWRWIVPVNVGVAVFVVGMAYWTSLTLAGLTLRVTAAQAALVQALSIGLLAFGTRRSQLQALSLWLGIAAAIPFSWVWVPPGMDAVWLHRLVAMFVAMVAMSVLYSVGIVKLIRRENEWTRAAQQLVRVTLALASLALAILMIVEVVHYRLDGAVPIRPAALALTAGTLAVLLAALLAAAVLPGRDPLNLDERRRTVYVYAAEILLSLLILHLRLTLPWLFAGVFEKYWPLVVMIIAFLGVGLSEFFRRRRQHVLSTPLANTGILLPMLPVLGYWIAPRTQVDYSGLLLGVGALYTVLAATRRSFLFAMAALAAVNGSLWYLLYRTEGLGMLEHPQLWIIPPALCVLAAVHLNRERLGRERVAATRYLTATFIYASSTADIFLNGVAQAPWLPLVLAAISLAGILGGIWLRIRAFLYLGTSFLLVALATVIWYAAVDLEQTWVWWVSGIVAGVLIIALFAIFEHRREQLLRLVDELKDWER